jgi:hypothetical protein
MAGKALKKQILADVAKKGGADYVYEVVASGKTITAWAAEEWDCSRAYLSKSLRTIPEYAAALDKALPEAADAMMEDGMARADALGKESTQSEIAAVREQINMRKALAAGWNRDRYGSGPRAEITLNLGDLHLDALRKISSDRQALMAEDREREMKVIEHDD